MNPWKRKEVIGEATLYLGDCLEILPTLPKVDAVIADPPYGIDYVPQYGKRRMPDGSWRLPETQMRVIGDKLPFNPTPFFCFPQVMLWGANHFFSRLPDVGRLLVWDKRCGVIPERTQSDCEIAWHNRKGAARIFRHVWDGMLRDSECDVSRVHPTQKPIALMRWCIEQCNLTPGSIILDPYAGSFTVAVAAAQMGFPSISIEIEPRYFEIGIERIANAQRQEKLFDDRPPAPLQEDFPI